MRPFGSELGDEGIDAFLRLPFEIASVSAIAQLAWNFSLFRRAPSLTLPRHDHGRGVIRRSVLGCGKSASGICSWASQRRLSSARSATRVFKVSRCFCAAAL